MGPAQVMTGPGFQITWKRGREILGGLMRQASMPIDLMLDDIGRRDVHRVAGTAVFMTTSMTGVPHALLHNLKHNKVLHERVMLLTVVIEDTPQFPESSFGSLDALAEAVLAAARRDQSGTVAIGEDKWFLTVINPPVDLAIIVPRDIQPLVDDAVVPQDRARAARQVIGRRHGERPGDGDGDRRERDGRGRHRDVYVHADGWQPGGGAVGQLQL